MIFFLAPYIFPGLFNISIFQSLNPEFSVFMSPSVSTSSIVYRGDVQSTLSRNVFLVVSCIFQFLIIHSLYFLALPHSICLPLIVVANLKISEKMEEEIEIRATSIHLAYKFIRLKTSNFLFSQFFFVPSTKLFDCCSKLQVPGVFFSDVSACPCEMKWNENR